MSRPAGIVEITQSGHTGWFDAGRLSTLGIEVFEPDYWQQKNAVTGTAKGRGTTLFVRDGDHELVLRHYRRGGLYGRLVKDAYLGTIVANSRAMQEFALLHWMCSKGLPVPAPVAAHMHRRGIFYCADILMESIVGARSLKDILAAAPLPMATWSDIGAVVRRFHDANVDHTDLNIHNILIDQAGAIWIIDFDKCRKRSSGPWKQDNLSRLLRSFRKEMAEFAKPHDAQEGWQALHAGYTANNQPS